VWESVEFYLSRFTIGFGFMMRGAVPASKVFALLF
jgi:hypothetical protein